MVIRQELVPLPGPHPSHLSVPDMHFMDRMHGTIRVCAVKVLVSIAAVGQLNSP